MKKILSAVIALAMILSIGSISAFAAETAVIEAVVSGTAPVAVGDVFQVTVQVASTSTNTLAGADIGLTYNPEVVAPCTADGTVITTETKTGQRLQALVQRTDFFDADTYEGIFAKTAVAVDVENSRITYTIYIHQDQEEIDGKVITLDGDFSPFVVYSAIFKVVGEGDAKIEMASDAMVNAVSGAEATLTKNNPTVVISGTPTEDKVVTGLAAPVAVEGAENLPETVDVTVEGETDTLNVAVAWDKTVVGTDAGDYTVPGTLTLPEGYVLKEGVAITATVTVEEPTPADKVVTGLAAPVAVEGAENLPETVDVTVEGETDTLNVAVAWDKTVVGTDAGDYTVPGTLTLPEGYVLKEGVAITATVTVEEPTPADKAVTGLAAPVAVKGAENLPETVDVTVEGETDTLNVAVAWDKTVVGTDAGDYTVPGTLTLPEGYVLKEGVAITATVTVEEEVITVTAQTEGDHAVNATITLDSTGKYTVNAVANTAYTGNNKLDGSDLYLVLTGYKVEGDKRVPYFVDIIPVVSLDALNAGGVRTLEGAYSNVNAISYSIIQGLDINNITGEGLGTAVTYVPMVSLAK